MDGAAYAQAHARLIVLARAIQATRIEDVVAAIDQWHASNPGFNDQHAKAGATSRVAVIEALARAALDFKKVVCRVLPQSQGATL